jgi:hypothetical protein
VPGWLERDQYIAYLAKSTSIKPIAITLKMGVDEELVVFYKKTNQAVILGDKRFRQQARKRPSLNCQPVNKKVYWFGQVQSRL